MFPANATVFYWLSLISLLGVLVTFFMKHRLTEGTHVLLHNGLFALFFLLSGIHYILVAKTDASVVGVVLWAGTGFMIFALYLLDRAKWIKVNDWLLLAAAATLTAGLGIWRYGETGSVWMGVLIVGLLILGILAVAGLLYGLAWWEQRNQKA